MKTNVLLRAGLTAALATAVSPFGCSFLFVTAPPDNHQKLYDFDCTSGNALPIVDTVLATVYGLSTVGMLSDRSEPRSTAATMAAAVAVFGTSAVLGYSRTKDCRDARAQLVVRLEGLRRPDAGPAGDPRWLPPAAADPWLAPGLMAPPAASMPFQGAAPAGDATPAAPSAAPAGTEAPKASPTAPASASPDSDRSKPNPQED